MECQCSDPFGVGVDGDLGSQMEKRWSPRCKLDTVRIWERGKGENGYLVLYGNYDPITAHYALLWLNYPGNGIYMNITYNE